MEWEQFVKSEEESNRGICIENAAKHGLSPEQADGCDEAHPLCQDCPLLCGDTIVQMAELLAKYSSKDETVEDIELITDGPNSIAGEYAVVKLADEPFYRIRYIVCSCCGYDEYEGNTIETREGAIAMAKVFIEEDKAN